MQRGLRSRRCSNGIKLFFVRIFTPGDSAHLPTRNGEGWADWCSRLGLGCKHDNLHCGFSPLKEARKVSPWSSLLLALSDSFYHHIIELLLGFVGAYSTTIIISAFSHPKVIALVSNIYLSQALMGFHLLLHRYNTLTYLGLLIINYRLFPGQ